MKVGPAYATLAENEALNHLRPGDRKVIGPSTGNFGIGTAYVSLLKGYQAIVVMPDNMSEERYDRIQKYRRQPRPDARHRVGRHPHARAHAQRVYQQAGRNTWCWPSLSCCPTIASTAT